jgi:hypothetical protein
MSGERLIGGSSGWAMVIVSVVAILGETYAFILGVDALTQLAAEPIVELDEPRKPAMVSNLRVVLTSDRSVQPIVNTGTLSG